MARIGDVGKVVTGNTPKTSDTQNYASNDICFVKPSDIADGIVSYLDDTEFYISEYARTTARVLPPKSVLVTCIGIIGKVAINNVECAFNQQINAIIPDESKCLTEYLAYAIQNKQAEMQDIANAPVVPILNKTQFSDIEIKLPPISEQHVIVEKLNAISKLIALRKEQLAKLDQLIKSRFIELFGDPVDNPKKYLVKSLQELIDMGYITYHLDGNHGGDYPRSEEFVDSGVPYIGANSIVNGKIDFSMAKFLTAERAGKLRKGIAQNDDVLFAHNATVGPTVVLKTTEPKVILSTSLTAYRCDKSRLLPNYLKAYMQSDGFVRQYSGEMKQTTRNQVPITAQKKYLFLVPPIVEQKQFAVFVEQTDKSKLAIQQSHDKLETLKKSLMQEYFG